MLRFLNKYFVILTFVFLLISCGFIDLRPIGLDIEPDKMNSLLAEAYSPIILKFDTEMNKDDAESILQINSDLGSIRGDKFWRGNSLYFVPVSGWTAGIRYTLVLAGSIRSADGRELRVERYLPFYAINRNSPPLLEWHSPSNGASVSAGYNTFEFIFSQPMDRQSTEAALILEGIGNKTFEWLDNDCLLKVTIDKALSPWIVYRWNLKDSAKSVSGVPLPKTYYGYFTTDIDQTLPQVTNVFPVLFSDGSWYPTGADIKTGLGQGQGIAVSFNKSMGESALRSLRFEPSLTGRAEYLSENSIVYIFTRDPEPGAAYTLIVSGDARDNEGLKIGADYKIYFTPDVPFMNVLSFAVLEKTSTDEPSIDESPIEIYSIENFSAANNVLPVRINPATGEFFFSIYFSQPFGSEEKQNTPQKIMLTHFFPRTLDPAALQYVRWVSDDRLYMRWEGLTAADDNIHFYKLTIPGGKGGVSPAAGVFMKHDLVLYLEVIK